MDELARNAVFVETEPCGRACCRPEPCRQSQRAGGFLRGNTCRCAHKDLDLRPIKGLATQGKKVRPEARRAGQFAASGGASASNGKLRSHTKYLMNAKRPL